jgi:hypothetical protein
MCISCCDEQQTAFPERGLLDVPDLGLVSRVSSVLQRDLFRASYVFLVATISSASSQGCKRIDSVC